MRKLLLILPGLLFGAALPLWAAPDPVIRESVAVCNPAVPTQCAKPDSSGNLPTTVGGSLPLPTAIAPVVSASAESGHVLKAAAGSLLSASATAGASAGYLMIFDATSAPGDGAVTPKYCIPIAANNFAAATWPIPASFATGITVVFSTSGCFTKTASATAFFSAQVQ